MTAPDPGLTDLIAAHRLDETDGTCTGCDWTWPDSFENDMYTDLSRIHPAHVAEAITESYAIAPRVETNPDPNLPDLIAGHWFNVSTAECTCGWSIRKLPSSDDDTGIGVLFARHVALVVEQHIAGRIAELEDGIMRAIHELIETRERAEKAEATIARAWSVLPNYSAEPGGKATAEQIAWLDGTKHVQRQLRAALEGEQQ